ncbi:hypothetical protein CEXT_594781, partial [Caerostris extrusa]
MHYYGDKGKNSSYGERKKEEKNK